MQVQITITLALIAVTAAIALFCDYLRVKNTQLRHAMAELEACTRARNEARGKADEAQNTAAKRTAPEQIARRKTAGSTGTQLGAGHTQPIQRKNKDEGMTSRQALSDWLIQRAAARAAQKTAEETKASDAGTCEPVPGRLPAPDRALKPFAVPARPVPVSVDAHLWESLTREEPETVPALGYATTFELIQGSGASNQELDVPAGMHSANVLEELTQKRKLFTGLVISIGVNEDPNGRSRELMHMLEGFVTELLRETDFGCVVNAEEFLLICPGPHGAQAQRYLSDVSARLWDFQLRTLGKHSVLFSLGGVDVQRESLSDAITQAKECMGQTRRSRNAGPASLAPQHRKAV